MTTPAPLGVVAGCLFLPPGSSTILYCRDKKIERGVAARDQIRKTRKKNGFSHNRDFLPTLYGVGYRVPKRRSPASPRPGTI